MHRAHLGITAYDLLVTMAVIAILLATTVPGLQAWARNRAMDAAVAGLRGDLQFARAEAVRLRSQVVACPGTAAGGCADQARWSDGWLVFADRDGDREWQPGEPLLRQAPAIRSPSITGSGSRQRLRFSPLGNAPGSNVTLQFCDDRGAGQARALRLSASGRLRVLGPGEAVPGAC